MRTQSKISRRLTFRELKTEKNIRESRMTIWRRIRDNKFPKPIADHGRVYWWEHEIDDHLAELANLPRGPGNRPSTSPKATTAQEERPLQVIEGFEEAVVRLWRMWNGRDVPAETGG